MDVFLQTLLVGAFSRLLPVRFLCARLDFDPVAIPFSLPNPSLLAAGVAYAAD